MVETLIAIFLSCLLIYLFYKLNKIEQEDYEKRKFS